MVKASAVGGGAQQRRAVLHGSFDIKCIREIYLSTYVHLKSHILKS
jgi:hypothetical protein